MFRSGDFPGKLFVFEGPDGVGKTSLSKYAHAKLLDLHDNGGWFPGATRILWMRQPTTRWREKIKEADPKNWLQVLYMFMRDRERQWEEELRPALEDRCIVVMDRYFLSSLVYQGLCFSAMFRGELEHADKLRYQRNVYDIIRGHSDFVVHPYMTFVVDEDDLIIHERLQASRGDTIDVFDENSIQTRVREIYRYLLSWDIDDCLEVGLPTMTTIHGRGRSIESIFEDDLRGMLIRALGYTKLASPI